MAETTMRHAGESDAGARRASAASPAGLGSGPSGASGASGSGRAAGVPGLCVLLAVLLGCETDRAPAQAQTSGAEPQRQEAPARAGVQHGVRTVTVVEGLEHPWAVAFLPGGEILVTERPGRLRVVRDGQLIAQPVAGVPEVWARGQGGLLDVVPHPDFASNRLVYLSYSKPGPRGATTAVIRGRFEGDRLTDVQEVIEARAWGTRGQHFGSRLAFDPEGYLYITTGDRGEMNRAQDLTDHAGAVLRLHDDGRVPADNPFVGRDDARPEIFTWGNRNGQGLAVHPETGQVWQNEHGPRGGDEVNLLQPGRNYGWPVITFGINYDGAPITDRTEQPGMEQPVHHWVPSIATSGMTFYTGDRFPGWRGDLFVGGLAGQVLSRLRLDGTRVVEEERLLENVGRIRDVRTGPDGYLYVLLDAARAPLLRLEPTS
jgi:aldose sugar dehydrogenase